LKKDLLHQVVALLAGGTVGVGELEDDAAVRLDSRLELKLVAPGRIARAHYSHSSLVTRRGALPAAPETVIRPAGRFVTRGHRAAATGRPVAARGPACQALDRIGEAMPRNARASL